MSAIDECGVGFRKSYGRIRNVRPWLSDHTAFLAPTATLEPGRQMEIIKEVLGMRPERLHFDKWDRQRHNVDIILRIVQHPRLHVLLSILRLHASSAIWTGPLQPPPPPTRQMFPRRSCTARRSKRAIVTLARFFHSPLKPRRIVLSGMSQRTSWVWE